jgi:hypothetical protein
MRRYRLLAAGGILLVSAACQILPGAPGSEDPAASPDGSVAPGASDDMTLPTPDATRGGLPVMPTPEVPPPRN